MKRWFTAAFVAAVALMIGICLFAGTLPYSPQSDEGNSLSDFSRDWVKTSAGTALAIDGAKYAVGEDSVTVSKALPGTLPRDAVLYMRSNHNEVSCYINGRELFCEGVCRERTFGIAYTGIWIIIPLETSDAGQTVTLEIEKTDGNMGQLPEELLLANRNALTNELVHQSALPVGIASFMLTLSVFMLIAGFLLRRRNTGNDNCIAVWLAVFIFMSAVWILTDDNVPRLFQPYNDAYYFLSFYCFMLLPVPFARFIGECIPKSRRVMLWFSGGFLLTFTLSVVAAVFFAQPLSLMLPMTHILILAGFFTVLVYAWRDKTQEGKLRLPEVFWGLCLFVATAAGALVSFYFGAIRVYALLFRIAALLFVSALSMGTMRRALREGARVRQFEKLTQIIPGGICRLNCRDGLSILYGNDTYYRMFGYEPEEARVDGFACFDHILLPEDREPIRRALMDKVQNNELYFEIETRALHKSGKLIYMMTANRYLPEKGEIVSVLTDITLRKHMEEQLRIQELEFRVAAEQSDKYIMRYEIKSGRLHAHRKAVQRFGVPEVCENAGQALVNLNFIGKGSLEKYWMLFEQISRGDAKGSAVLQLYARDLSAFRWYHVDFTTVYDHDQKPDQAVISFYDVTQQRERELAYERMRQEAAAVPQEQITTFSCNLTQNEVDESSGSLINDLASGQDFDAYTQAYSALTHPDDQPALRRLMNRASLTARFKNGVSSHTLEFRLHLGGAYRWLRLSVQVVKYADNDDLKAFVVIRDIDAQKNSELALIQRSETDSLTGIMNRAAYVDAVNTLIASQGRRRHVLVMMDVDHFKDVNDTLGHDMGDQVLRGVAADLRGTLREGDLLGRMGGDEFSFCFVNLYDEATLKILLERVRSELNHDIGGGLCQSVSIGAAAFDGDAGDFVEVYKKADLALYRAKENGRNQFALYSDP